MFKPATFLFVFVTQVAFGQVSKLILDIGTSPNVVTSLITSGINGGNFVMVNNRSDTRFQFSPALDYRLGLSLKRPESSFSIRYSLTNYTTNIKSDFVILEKMFIRLRERRNMLSLLYRKDVWRKKKSSFYLEAGISGLFDRIDISREFVNTLPTSNGVPGFYLLENYRSKGGINLLVNSGFAWQYNLSQKAAICLGIFNNTGFRNLNTNMTYFFAIRPGGIEDSYGNNTSMYKGDKFGLNVLFSHQLTR